MYNLSIQSSSFPKVWKNALVIPIPKQGNLTKVQNYRPISLLPLPGKILEKLIHQQLTAHLDSESLLADEQHGFRKKHSTTHAVAQVTDYVSKNLDLRIPTVAAFIDFKKALDCVQHPVLLNKLNDLNLSEEVKAWVKSYLTGRNQRVLANNVYSTFCDNRPPSGWLRGAKPLGPFLGPLTSFPSV